MKGTDMLGHTFVDVISKFQGVATGHCIYISGCNQVLLTPQAKDSGEAPEGKWFDEQRLELVPGRGHIRLENGTTPGCDIAPPVR